MKQFQRKTTKKLTYKLNKNQKGPNIKDTIEYRHPD